MRLITWHKQVEGAHSCCTYGSGQRVSIVLATTTKNSYGRPLSLFNRAQKYVVFALWFSIVISV